MYVSRRLLSMQDILTKTPKNIPVTLSILGRTGNRSLRVIGGLYSKLIVSIQFTKGRHLKISPFCKMTEVDIGVETSFLKCRLYITVSKICEFEEISSR